MTARVYPPEGTDPTPGEWEHSHRNGVMYVRPLGRLGEPAGPWMSIQQWRGPAPECNCGAGPKDYCGVRAEVVAADASVGTGPGGKKDDAGKVRFALLPWSVLRGVAQVLTHGAVKYEVHSWQKVPNPIERYRSGHERHWDAGVHEGQALDADSGLPHAWHMVCNSMFLAWFMVFRPEVVKEYAARYTE
jgi:hypothetical protein